MKARKKKTVRFLELRKNGYVGPRKGSATAPSEWRHRYYRYVRLMLRRYPNLHTTELGVPNNSSIKAIIGMDFDTWSPAAAKRFHKKWHKEADDLFQSNQEPPVDVRAYRPPEERK